MENERLEGIIESILFTMGDSVEVSKIAKAIEQDEETTKSLIYHMMENIQRRIEAYGFWS